MQGADVWEEQAHFCLSSCYCRDWMEIIPSWSFTLLKLTGLFVRAGTTCMDNPSLRGTGLADQWLAISWNHRFFKSFYMIESTNCTLKITNCKVIVCHCCAIHHSIRCYNLYFCLIWNEIINSPERNLSLRTPLLWQLALWGDELQWSFLILP